MTRRLDHYRDLSAIRRRFSATTKRLDAAIATLENSEDPAACGRARRAALLSSAALATLDRDLRDLLGPADRHSDVNVSCDGPKAARAAIADVASALDKGDIDSHQAAAVAMMARAHIGAEEVGRLDARIRWLEDREISTRVFGRAPAGLSDEQHAAMAIVAKAVKGGSLTLSYEPDELTAALETVEAAGVDVSSIAVWKKAPPKYWRSATRKRAAKPN